MKILSTVMAACVLVSSGQLACAQGHFDVQFSYVQGKIDVAPPTGATDLVFESNFPTFGIEQQFATLPGLASEAAAGLGIGAGDQIFYDVLDDLLYWDGTDLTTPPENYLIRVSNNPPSVPDTIIDEDSGQQLGSEDPLQNRIGAADDIGDFHVDLQWRLEPNPFPQPSPPEDFGAYGVKLRLSTSAAGIAKSAPLIFAFNFGLNNTGFEQAVEAFRSLLTPGLEGDIDDDDDVDGHDFQLWQRGLSPDPLSAGDLSDWESRYGTINPPLQQFAVGVPEPASLSLYLVGATLLLNARLQIQICSDNKVRLPFTEIGKEQSMN